MNQRIINTYGIGLTRKEIGFDLFGIEVMKVFTSNESSLDELFNGLIYPQDLEEYMLPDIGKALANPGSEFEGGSETIIVKIDCVKVDLFTADYDFLFTLPTLDFKEMVEGWLAFLNDMDLRKNPR